MSVDRAEDGRRIDRDALAHSVAWALLALTGGWVDGGLVGLALLFGPLPPMTAVTWWYLIGQGEIPAARNARWAVLAASAVIYGVYRALV